METSAKVRILDSSYELCDFFYKMQIKELVKEFSKL